MIISLSYILWLENGLELIVEDDIEFPGLKTWEGKVIKILVHTHECAWICYEINLHFTVRG